nr:mucin-4-like [Desmodus rotundus]
MTIRSRAWRSTGNLQPVISAVSTPFSSISEHTFTECISQERSTTHHKSTLFVSSVSISSLTSSDISTAAISTYTIVRNKMDTPLPASKSISTVTLAVSVTTGLEGQPKPSSFSTSTQDTPASSQNYQTEVMETTVEPEFCEITVVITSIPFFLPSEHILSGSISLATSSSGETALSSSFSVSNTALSTSEMLTAPTSKYAMVDNTRETSLSVSRGFLPLTSKVSTTWESDIPSVSLSTSSSTPKLSTVFHTHQNKDTKTMGWPSKSNSYFTDISRETFTPSETTTVTSSCFIDSYVTQSQKELLSTPIAATILVTENISTSTASTISWVTSKVSTIG